MPLPVPAFFPPGQGLMCKPGKYYIYYCKITHSSSHPHVYILYLWPVTSRFYVSGRSICQLSPRKQSLHISFVSCVTLPSKIEIQTQPSTTFQSDHLRILRPSDKVAPSLWLLAGDNSPPTPHTGDVLMNIHQSWSLCPEGTLILGNGRDWPLHLQEQHSVLFRSYWGCCFPPSTLPQPELSLWERITAVCNVCICLCLQLYIVSCVCAQICLQVDCGHTHQCTNP